jgi:hypothetical protein
MINKFASAAVAATMMMGVSAMDARALPVDLELALLVDVSGSINATEFTQQMRGYGNAFRNASIQSDILDTTGGRLGKIAVTLVQWANGQTQRIGWTLLDSAASINAFAELLCPAVGACPARPTTVGSGTSIGPAIDFAVPLFVDNGFEGTFEVIDVSGDGSSTVSTTAAARDAALAAGIDRINGITIGGGTSLFDFYNLNVKGGTGAFVLAAADFEGFETAIAQKLGFEIRNEDPANPPATGVPVPATAALFGAALVGLVAARRRKA